MGYQGSVGMMPSGDVKDHQHLLQALSHAGWNVAKAARLLGVSRPTLYRKMVEAGLTRPA
jgi:transcriptional regulator of acetoin/glycerol metabolism